jgi:hypothetical protein
VQLGIVWSKINSSNGFIKFQGLLGLRIITLTHIYLGKFLTVSFSLKEHILEDGSATVIRSKCGTERVDVGVSL